MLTNHQWGLAPGGNIAGNAQDIFPSLEFQNYWFEITAAYPTRWRRLMKCLFSACDLKTWPVICFVAQCCVWLRFILGLVVAITDCSFLFLEIILIFHLLTRTSSNENIFRVTGPLCGEFTGHRWIPLTKASDARSLDVFSDLCLNKRLSKQSWSWWFETPSCHYDVIVMYSVTCTKSMEYNILFNKNIKPGTLDSQYSNVSCIDKYYFCYFIIIAYVVWWSWVVGIAIFSLAMHGG